MKKRALFLPLSLLALVGCAPSHAAPDLSEYVGTAAYKEGMKILQLADFHFNLGSDMESLLSYVDRLVEVTEPDMIVLTGDQIMGGTKSSVTLMMERLETYDVPYAFAYGNHDFQGLYGISWLNDTLGDTEKYPHTLFRNVEDEVKGWSNYAVDLMDGNSRKFRLYFLDSGSYDTSGLKYGYETMEEDQAEWVSSLMDEAREEDGSYVPSVAYFHVPTVEFQESYEDVSGRKSGEWGYLHEGFSSSHVDSGIFEAMRDRNCKGMFIGHDHSNTYTSVYDGVVLGYGVKTGNQLYYTYVEKGESEKYPEERFPLLGASLLTIGSSGITGLTHHYVDPFDGNMTHRYETLIGEDAL